MKFSRSHLPCRPGSRVDAPRVQCPTDQRDTRPTRAKTPRTGPKPRPWALAALALGVTSTLMGAGCRGAIEEQVAPEASVLNYTQAALSSASVRYLNGTYGPGCEGRSGNWSQSLASTPGTMPYPTLFVLANDPGCQLTITALVADVTYLASPPLPLGPDYAAQPSSFTATPGVALTLAGSGAAAFADATATAASFSSPSGTAVDAAGNVYLADTNNHRIRKITPAGVVTTVAGSGTSGYLDGSTSTARFRNPHDVVIDAAGNLYVSDTGNHCVRKVSPLGVVSTLAGSVSPGFVDAVGAAARFNAPRGIALEASGNLVIADASNNRVRRVTPTGTVTTVAGTGALGLTNGPASSATFRTPYGVAVDATGNVFVADLNNHAVRKIAGGAVTTLAGTGAAGAVDGAASAASFSSPADVTTDGAGNVFVADRGNHRLRRVYDGVVSTVAGSTAGYVDATGADARFHVPTGVVADDDGNLFVADTSNHRVRRVTTGTLSSFFGNARLDTVTNQLSFVVADSPLPPSVLEVDVEAKTVGATVSVGTVAGPDYTFDLGGVTVQVKANKVVKSVSGFVQLTDGTRPGSSYVVVAGALPEAPSLTECDDAFQVGTPTPITGPNPAIAGASLIEVGTSLASPALRTVIVRRVVSGVVAYQVIRLTFDGP